MKQKYKKTTTKWSESGSSKEVKETKKVTSNSKTTVSSATKVSSGVISSESKGELSKEQKALSVVASDGGGARDYAKGGSKPEGGKKEVSDNSSSSAKDVDSTSKSSSEKSKSNHNKNSSTPSHKKEEKCICEICTCGKEKMKKGETHSISLLSLSQGDPFFLKGLLTSTI
ncbi:Hypothetical protein FKW44_013934 [Caligus rogercresseyi]|uniref:Uncharacterized protein n=1 Tax=Caligus rogercresseyi TaxID=217165 RepID=A0A7T8JZD7_CALRO|nr:Hypothetical protein FKW44_013934 [Caligus rogercresseyi]